METCLVTGGAGFIGSWLCESLMSKGFRVICVDNLITGSESNIAHLRKNENFVFVKNDVSKSLEAGGDVHYIFHLASPASPIDYQNLPIETMMVNSLGTLNALNLASEKNARFLLASTSEVYGDPEQHPQKETYWGNVNTLGPRSCYDESKRFGESLSMIYNKRKGVDLRIARIFNTYGPRMRRNDGRVIPNFITQSLEKKCVTVYGDGSQTRSFCYVTDLVAGLEKLVFSEGLSGEVFNIGNPTEYSILDTAKKIREIVKSESEIVFRDMPEDDPVKRKPDITKASERLGWKPTVGFEQGLEKTIDWFRK